MSARSYLSIGDVLTLLRQEFPDVTISKIRFLESQGLVNPERTPSGYRKFYEHDVERLRWVLRQQREHFLPLKVIKDRLDEDTVGVVADPAAPQGRRPARASVSTDPTDPTSSDGGRHRDDGAAAEQHTTDDQPAAEPVLVGQRASVGPSPSAVSADPSGLPGLEPAASHSASPTAAAPVERAHHVSLATSHTVPDSAVTHGSGNGAGSHRAPSRATTAQGPDPAGSGDGAEPTDGAEPAPDVAPVKAAAKSTGRTAGRAARSAARPAPAVEPAPADDTAASGSDGAGGGGASLSLEELTSASGLSEEYVRQLQEFGLIRATTVAGAPFYDEEALTVTRVAARFAAFGIEARHLRLYKNAADREAGFIEQVVIPMVRQRNPEARARARQTAGDLAALGQELKASLVRSALSELLNG